MSEHGVYFLLNVFVSEGTGSKSLTSQAGG